MDFGRSRPAEGYLPRQDQGILSEGTSIYNLLIKLDFTRIWLAHGGCLRDYNFGNSILSRM